MKLLPRLITFTRKSIARFEVWKFADYQRLYNMGPKPYWIPDQPNAGVWGHQRENGLQRDINYAQGAVAEAQRYGDGQIVEPDMAATEPTPGPVSEIARKVKKPRKPRGRKKSTHVGDDGKPENVIPSILGQQPQQDWRKGDGIREVLQRKPNGMFFSSYEDFKQCSNGPAWEPPANDETVPLSDDQMEPYVKKLTAALTDMTQFIDKPGNVMKKRWLDQDYEEGKQNSAQVTNGFYPEHAFEGVAWEIAVSTRLFRNS